MFWDSQKSTPLVSTLRANDLVSDVNVIAFEWIRCPRLNLIITHKFADRCRQRVYESPLSREQPSYSPLKRGLGGFWNGCQIENMLSYNKGLRGYSRTLRRNMMEAFVIRKIPPTPFSRGSNKPFQARVYRLMGNDKRVRGGCEEKEGQELLATD